MKPRNKQPYLLTGIALKKIIGILVFCLVAEFAFTQPGQPKCDWEVLDFSGHSDDGIQFSYIVYSALIKQIPTTALYEATLLVNSDTKKLKSVSLRNSVTHVVTTMSDVEVLKNDLQLPCTTIPAGSYSFKNKNTNVVLYYKYSGDKMFCFYVPGALAPVKIKTN